MAKSIDTKVVQMEFDNKNFEQNTHTTINSLKKLKEGLNMNGAEKGFNNIKNAASNVKLDNISNGVENIKSKFSTLGVIAITALQNITNKAVDAGLNIAKALTIEPLMTGLQEYELKIGSIQTIMSNTQGKNSMQEVNDVLQELNLYADQTIYNFAEMTRNIGTFTAAGIDLQTSATAIKGIANLAAASGSSSQQASTAMYQLSQALAAGSVKLQDWNSVVNAGMGGKLFQDALRQTAKELGGGIAESENFRESLKKGWITTEVLTKTLEKFAADESMLEAATKVKTFTQLIDTLKESVQSGWGQSWEIIIGNFDEAKELWTGVSNALGNLIDQSSNARNQLLQGWKDLGGREAIINSIKNIWEALLKVLKPVQEAFRNIFPPMTAEKLVSFSKGLEQLTSKLIISDQTASGVKTAFEGFFSIIKFGMDVVGFLFKAFLNLVGALKPLGAAFITVIAKVGEFVIKLKDAVVGSGVFQKIISTAMNGITTAAGFVSQRISEIINFLTRNISFNWLSDLKSVLETAKIKFEEVKNVVSNFFAGTSINSDGLTSKLELIKNKFAQIKEFVIGLGEKIKPVFQKIGEYLKNIDWKTVFEGVKTGAVAFIGFKIGKLIGGIGDALGNITAPFESLTGVLDSVQGALQKWQTNLNAKALIQIAIAVGVLTASLLVLSKIPTEQLSGGLLAITGLFLNMKTMLNSLSKTASGPGVKDLKKLVIPLIGLSIALGILAGSLRKIASLDTDAISRSLIGLTGISLILQNTAKNLAGANGGLLKSGMQLIALSIAINILVLAMKQLASMKIPELIKGLTSLGVLLTELAIFTKLADLDKTSTTSSAGILLLGASLLVFSLAIKSFAKIPVKDIIKGMVVIEGVFNSLARLTQKMDSSNLLGSGIGFILISSSLLIFGAAIKSIAQISWENLAKGLITIGTALFIMSAGANAMNGAVAGAVAIGIMAVSLTLLMVPLSALSLMSWEGIAKGLIGLGGAFLVIGISMAIIAPLVPAILGFSVAIGILAGTIGIAALGIAALATSLLALSAIGAAGVAGLVLMLQQLVKGVLDMLPQIVEGVGKIIEAGTKVIIEQTPNVLQAILTLGIAALQVLFTLGPQIIEVAIFLLESLLTTIDSHMPRLIELGMNIMVSFVQGIANKIGDLTNAAVDLILNFINAISSRIGDITDAATNLVISFIEGMTNAFSKHMPRVVAALENLLATLIKTIIKVLADAVTFIYEGGKKLFETGFLKGVGSVFSSIFDTIKKLLTDILLSIANFLTDFYNAGKNSLQKMLDGFISMTSSLINKAKEIVTNIITGIKDFLSQFYNTGKELFTKLLEGISSMINNLVNKVTETINNIVNRIKTFYNQFLETGKTIITNIINGVSSKINEIIAKIEEMLTGMKNKITGWNSNFTEAGKNIVDGFISGIKSSIQRAANAAAELARNALNAAKNALDINSPSREFVKIGLFSGEGLIEGLNNSKKNVEKVSYKMGISSANSLKEAIEKTINDIGSDFNINPVITPIIDISKAKKDISSINSSLNGTKLLAFGISNSNNGTDEYLGKETNIVFNQNNYSPKSLSRYDIYIQTKNQLELLRGKI